MMRRAAAVAAAIVTVVSASPSQSATEPASWKPEIAATDQPRLYLLTFTDEDIPVVAGQVLGTVLKTPFEIEPSVSGKMSLVVEERLTRAQLLGVLEAALARNGAALTRRDGVLRVTPRSVPPPADAAARRTGKAYRADEMVSAALRYNGATPSAPAPKSKPAAGNPWKIATFALGALALALLIVSGVAGFAWATKTSVGKVFGRRWGGGARQAVLDRLCQQGLVDPVALSVAQSNAAVSGRPVEHVLNGMGVVSDEALVLAYAAVTGLPIWRPEVLPPLLWNSEPYLSAEGLTRRGMVPVGVEADRLTLATSDPLDNESLAGVALEAARKVSIMICAPSDVRRAIAAI